MNEKIELTRDVARQRMQKAVGDRKELYDKKTSVREET